jgi:hypothetical protein
MRCGGGSSGSDDEEGSSWAAVLKVKV